MNIYVANIPWKASEEELRALFAEYGEIDSAKIITDKFTQRSRGFGFVEMKDDDAARRAITELNGQDFMGKNLVVNEARPKEDRGGGGGGYRS
ncbi:MAG TPA: RNA-binding protein [Cyclobacteriaceae bacterium]|nr:RNA-binding protein [Cyclobacteriaceae bacterium]HNP07520.1 RNA-binding protein [Cyclobacteriaceae bacterium]HRK53271.1 RNA-binding protein [Cyclobacteriaceae bacterium]